MANPDTAIALSDSEVKESQDYQSLTISCKDGLELIRRGETCLIEGYWLIGTYLYKLKETEDRFGYGDQVVSIFCNQHRLHQTTVYQAMTLAEEYPHFQLEGGPQAVEGLLDDLEKRGMSRSWTSVRNRVRLLGTGKKDPQTDSKQAHKVGGSSRQIDDLLSRLQGDRTRIDEYIGNGIPKEHQAEVAGTLAELALTCIPLAEKIAPGIIFDQPGIDQSEEHEESSQEPAIEAPVEVLSFNPVEITPEYIESRTREIQNNVGCACCATGERAKITRFLQWPNAKKSETEIGLCAKHESQYQSGEEHQAGSGCMHLWSRNQAAIISHFFEITEVAIESAAIWRNQAIVENEDNETF